MRRILTETEYQRPSLCNTTTRIPGGAIRGDLDWIVMKALERDKERRYSSVEALTEDIRRHLADEPVTAGPPTVGYRLRKFVRRNRAVVGGSAIAVAALLAGTGISISQAMRARTAESEAVAQAEAAETEKKISDAINQFFIEDLLGADLRNTARADVTLRELVDLAASKTEERFRGQPEVARAVEMAIGDLYDALGEFEKAEASYLRCREHHESTEESGDRGKVGLQILYRLAVNASRQGRTAKEGEYWDEWAALASRTEAPIKHLLSAKMQRALMLADAGKTSEAIERVRALLPEFEEHFGPDHPSTLKLKINLGRNLVAVRDSEAGVPLIEEYIEKTRPAGKTIGLSNALTDLGLEYARQGRLAESKKAYEEAIEIQEETLEPDHLTRLRTRSSLAASYRLTGRPELATSTYREIFELGKRGGDPMPLECLIAGLNYGMGIIMASPGAAKPVFEKVLQGFDERGTEYGSFRFQTSFQLAISMWLTGQKDEAVSHLNDQVAYEIEKDGESNPQAQELRKVLMQLELERGRPAAALPYARAARAAPIPTNGHLRQGAQRAIEAVLGMVENSFKDQPELLVEMFRRALTSGFTGDEVWRGLGIALHERYRSGRELRDLRLASLCLLRAGKVNDAAGIRIVTEWIEEDELAKGLQAPGLLIGPQTVWHYQEVTPADSAWRQSGFDAGGWPTGRGEFGYGDGDEVTVLGFGDDPKKKPMSACFRLELTVDEAFQRPLVATIAHDDGAVVYLDGQEVYRALMPQGDPKPDTPATGTEVIESLPHGFAITPERFPPGRPVVVAVQVHQTPHDTDDLSFAFSLAEPMPTLKDALDRIPPTELDAFFGGVVESLTGSPGGGKR